VTASLSRVVAVAVASNHLLRYKGNFELTYVSKSTIVAKSLSTGSRTVLTSGAW
jgi:hypothetical protein